MLVTEEKQAESPQRPRIQNDKQMLSLSLERILFEVHFSRGWSSIPRWGGGGRGGGGVVARQTFPKITSCIPQNSCPAVLHPPKAWHPSLLCLYHTHLMVLAVTPHTVLEDEQYPLWRGKLQVASGISRPLRAAL